MADITGTIQDAAGNGVQYVVVRLSPSSPTEGGAEVISGIGLVLNPVEVETDTAGAFTLGSLPGYRYRLEIPAIGYDREFVGPASDTAFHLLGVKPDIDQALPSQDADGDWSIDVRVRVEDEATVRERFSTISLERSNTLGGVYAEVQTFDLLAGEKFYDWTDTSDPASGVKFYRARYTASGPVYSEFSDIVSSEATDESELALPVQELIEHYLFGLDLTDDDGNPFPRSMFEHYIRAAVGWLEKELDIPITPVDISRETHDHYAQDYGRWGYLQLNRFPLIGVPSKVEFQYPSMTDSVEINSQWIVTEDEGASGVIQIVPGQGGIADVLLIPGQLMPLWSGASGRVPGIWHVTYRAGFEYGQIPDDVKHMLAMQASIGILNIAGDLIVGAGIANKSVTIPGLSQNIGTTSSATNAGFGARIIEYQKEMKAALPRLRQFYGKTQRMVVG